MPATKLTKFLDDHHVPYETVHHAPTYTAQKTAAAAHVTGKALAKTVMIRVAGRLAMAVLPAPLQVDFRALSEGLDGAPVSLADEADFRARFPDCEVGAMPPFGNLYELDVYVDRHLTEDETIAFTACSHTELIQLPYREYETLVQPTVLAFAVGAA
jgi:Ala-tRNA(Pro) deacylase